MDIYSLVASLLGIIYVILAARNNRNCFFFGFIGAGIWCYADIFIYNLRFDAILQIYYAVMAMIGYIIWGKSTQQTPIRKLSLLGHLAMICASLVLSFLMFYVVMSYTASAIPHLDAITTAVSIFATIILSLRYIDNWLYLLAANLCYIFIYCQQEAYIFMVMMVFYSVMAIVGYLSWSNMLNRGSGLQ